MRLSEKLGLGGLLRRLPAWKGMLVLNYHRIGDGRESLYDLDLYSATADAFEAQVAFLARSSDLITPADLEAVMRQGRGRHVMLTFDDGYLDNAEVAFPILRAHGASACFFLATGFIDRPRLAWWDEIAWMVRTSPGVALPAGPWTARAVAFDEGDRRHRAVHALLDRFKELEGAEPERFLDWIAEVAGTGRAPSACARDMWMSWDDARRLRDGGMTVGGHTETHPVLARLDPSRQGAEIAGCARRLHEELGEPMRYFSYPVGQRWSFDAVTRERLRAEGVQLAFSYYGGYQRFGRWDPFDVPRSTVAWFMSPAVVAASATLPQLFARW